MPIQVYKCADCGYLDEVLVPHEAVRGKCEKCNGDMVRDPSWERPVVKGETTVGSKLK